MEINSISNLTYQDTASLRKPENDQREFRIQEQVQEKKREVSDNVKLKLDNSTEFNAKKEHASEEHIKSAISKANQSLKKTKAEFTYHEKLNRVSIKIMDEETGEVIREIPPEKTLEMIEKMLELAGIFFDEKI